MRNLFRTTVIAGVALFLGMGSGQASAAETPGGSPNAQDLAAIGDLVSGQQTIERLAGTVFPDTTPASAADAAHTASADAAGAVPVYRPTAAFVSGASSAPAELAYVAIPATTGNGAAATLWAHRKDADWSVYNVASGSMEHELATRLDGGYLMHEPQVNAWYAVDGDTVTVLHGSVTGLAEGTTMSVAELQNGLHQRYGDKLPGSTYDRTGAAGGYGPSAEAKPSGPPVLPFAVGGAVVVLGGAAVFAVPRLRRR